MPDTSAAWWRKHRRWRRRVMVVAGLLFALSVFVALGLNDGLTVRAYRIVSEKLTNREPIRLVLITDLHSQVFGEAQEPLIDRVAALKPDVVCLVGDIADDRSPFDGAARLLSGLTALAPCLYVAGNHEYWGDAEAIVRAIRDLGVTVLEGETTDINIRGQTIRFDGLIDPVYSRKEAYDTWLAPFGSVSPAVFTVLLSHRPDPVELFSRRGYDLVLSGHTHGGMIRVPLLINGLYAPDQGWFPRYAGGLYRVGGTALIVSRGLQIYADVPRFYNPPEISAVDLVAAH